MHHGLHRFVRNRKRKRWNRGNGGGYLEEFDKVDLLYKRRAGRAFTGVSFVAFIRRTDYAAGPRE